MRSYMKFGPVVGTGHHEEHFCEIILKSRDVVYRF